jgi:hypothetical protein
VAISDRRDVSPREQRSGAATFVCQLALLAEKTSPASMAQSLHQVPSMNNVIYIVGLVVVVAAVLSFFGLR